MEPVPLPTDELAARFTGKRAAERFECRVAVILHSGNRQFPGEAINISRTGVLVRMRYAALSGTVSRMRVGSAMDAADRHFGTQFRLEIPGTSIDRTVVLVRMAMEVSEPEALRLGCEFRGSISDEDVEFVAHVNAPTPE